LAIIIKFIVKSIWENKFRSFLILLSITLSAALFFSTIAMSGTIEQMFLEQVRKYIGNAEIVIYPNENSPGDMLRMNSTLEFEDEMEYVIGYTLGNAIIRKIDAPDIQIDLRGYRLEDLEKMNPITLENELDIMPFNGKKAVIGRTDADRLEIGVGDNIIMEIKDRRHSFYICGIASSEGLFRPEAESITILVPRETLAALYGSRDMVHRIFLKTVDSEQLDHYLASLSSVYNRYTVAETISQSELESYGRGITVPFFLMLTLVVFISVFIIYSSFKVIALERIPVIGTFRSLGATKRTTNTILLGESLLYGLLGGSFGVLVGRIILKIVTMVLAHNPYNDTPMSMEIVYDQSHILMALIGATVLALVSSLAPIVKVSKIPVKDIVLNNLDTKVTLRRWKPLLGLLLIGCGLTMPHIYSGDHALLVFAVTMLIAVVGLIFTIPLVTGLMIIIFSHIYIFVFGNIGLLALKNIKNNKSIIDNAALLTIGIASLLLISIITYSVSVEVVNVYGQAQYDIYIAMSEGSRRTEQRIRAINGVEDVLECHVAYNVQISGAEQSIFSLYGVDIEKYFTYHTFEIIGDRETIIARAPEGRNIILNSILLDRFSLSPGDIIILKTPKGDVPYSIIGSVSTLWNNGDMAIIPQKYMAWDMAGEYRTDYFVSSNGEPGMAKDRIESKFLREGVIGYIDTMDEMQRKNNESNNGLFALLGGFSVITMIIGSVGVFNNYIVSMISRRRSLAMMRSVGMSRAQTVKMLFIEALSGGIIGGAAGILGGVLLIELVTHVLRAINLPIALHHSSLLFITALISGIAVSVIASVSPALKTSRMNVIKAIRYE